MTVAIAAPCTPHSKPKNKQRVQRNVEYRANEDAEHADGGKPLGGNKAVKAHCQLNKQRTAYINGQVVVRIINGVVACPQTYRGADA